MYILLGAEPQNPNTGYHYCNAALSLDPTLINSSLKLYFAIFKL